MLTTFKLSGAAAFCRIPLSDLFDNQRGLFRICHASAMDKMGSGLIECLPSHSLDPGLLLQALYPTTRFFSRAV
jgi:hypothetical protein